MKANEQDKNGYGFNLKNDNGVIEGNGIIHDAAKDIPLLNIPFYLILFL